MHPTDVFLKNTHEVLGPLHEGTAHDRLTWFHYLNSDRTVRQAVYGHGENATRVIVNFGTTKAEVKSALGGRVVLPPWGFVIEGPRFAGKSDPVYFVQVIIEFLAILLSGGV